MYQNRCLPMLRIAGTATLARNRLALYSNLRVRLQTTAMRPWGVPLLQLSFLRLAHDR